jgi:uncharacterized protein YutE (UPF0331/DUF86 family)
MTKPEVVLRRLASLEERVALLEQQQAQDLAALTADPVRWNGVLHLLQVSVEIVVDIAAHSVADWPAQVPDSHRLTLLKLGELGVIPADFAARIAPMTTFRNIVVHNYLTVDPALS